MSWSQIEAVTSDVSVGVEGLSGEARVLEVPAKGVTSEMLSDLTTKLRKERKAKAVSADPINSPSHYKVGGIETIDFIEAKDLGYNLGNVVKYITRAHHKGELLQDLKKAQWYLNREVGKLEEK